MWPFNKPKISIECSFPRFNRDDQDFICRNLIEDLNDCLGLCYNIEIKLRTNTKIEISNTKNSNEIKHRAIRIFIHRKINYYK